MRRLERGLAFCLALAGVMIPALEGRSQSTKTEKSAATQPEAREIVTLANQERTAAGAAPLQWDPALAGAARQHCLRMAAEGPISHRYPGEADLTVRAGQAGAHFSLIEENVAVGPDPATIHDEWMHSSGHRSNLLNRDVDRVGVAVVYSRGTLYAVADYERTVETLTQAQVESAVAGLLRSSGVAIQPDAKLARVACAMDRGMPTAKSSLQPRFVMRWQDADLSALPQALVDHLASGKYREAAVGSCAAKAGVGAFTAYRVAVLLF